MNEEKEKVYYFEDEKISVFKRPLTRQCFIMFGMTCILFSSGLGVGTPTVMVPQLKLEGSKEFLVEKPLSWIYSIHGFGSLASGLVVPFLSQWKGRKVLFIINCVPLILSNVVKIFANNIYQLLFAEILQGINKGGNIIVCAIALTEYVDPKYRGCFLIIKSSTFFWGIWAANTIGTFTSWRSIPNFGVTTSLLAFLLAFFWPESPSWLATKGRVDECVVCYRWVRGISKTSEAELDTLLKDSQTKLRIKKSFWYTGLKTSILSPDVYTPLFLILIMFLLYFSTGKLVLTVFSLDIIRSITKDSTSAYYGMLGLDGCTLLGMFFGCYLSTIAKRKTLYLTSSLLSTTILFFMSVYLLLIQFSFFLQKPAVLFSVLAFYTFVVCSGPILLSTSVFAEITPSHSQCLVMSLFGFICYALHVAYLKTAPALFQNLGFGGTFLLYSVISSVSLFLLYKYLPETKDKTMSEISKMYQLKKSRIVISGSELL